MSKTNNKVKSIISILLTICMLASFVPTAVFAAQSNEYVDPADSWLSSNNRTNELDVNATITNETQYCCVCEKNTSVLTYRVPEYTKSGETAKNRDVQYSDGTKIDGYNKGNLDDGTPGIDAYFTGYHWTKAVCQTCGTINSGDGAGAYNFNNNVYSLNSCDHNFFLEFDNTTHEYYDEDYHLTTLKRGEYCKFCKGTFARASQGLQDHDFIETVDAQLGNNRFYIRETCEDCDFETSEYVTAKSVVTSYYGTADGEAHTLEVTNLSERGVNTTILYGNSADSCTKTSAPNYTQAGYYTVYYKINYTYGGETMTENGVSYIWLVADDEDKENGGAVVVLPTAHEHDYHYLETVASSCDNLGYDRFQCNGCGDLIKSNYTQSKGHNHKAITIREATCKQGGLKLWLCGECGDFYEESTPLAAHSYNTEKHNPTCRMTGYTDHICEVCGNNYITDITPIINHSFEGITKEPTCTDKGYTTRTCTMCDYHYVSDYTDPIGHAWDDGHTVTSSTCEAEGVIEFNCTNDGCNEKMIKATNANGHTPGAEATCTDPQRCEVCETVIELPVGHDYDSEIVEPSCVAMGYTIYTCHCGDTYTGNYTDIIPHDYNVVVTPPTCTEHGFSNYTCVDCNDTYIADYTDKLQHSYKAEITKPTCTSLGFTTYTCEDCADTYKADYVEMTEHNYNKQTIEPTCTEHGFSIYICPDCNKEFIADYTDVKEHHYTETVIAPTCTEMGYSIFKCDDCGEEYKGNYTDKIAHDYIGTVTEPTCLTLGFTTFVCSVCNDTYKSEYKEALGHTPSEWIIDTAATIESAGAKHIECMTCGEILRTAEIPQLMDKDYSDEDGRAKIGDYSLILTDKDGKPIFNSEITIDVNDNVTIKLPNGRLLDYADQTTITAIYTDTQAAKADLQMFIYDEKNNAATGKTNADGQLKVPNNQSSTGDDNGTIGKDDSEVKTTFVVRVTDKTNTIIPNCDVYIGESNNLVVDLPDGTRPTTEAPVIITVTDQNGNAQKDITVIALGEADYIEKGKTDIYGKVTLPITNEGYTDKDGKVNVNAVNVIVNDETGLIPNAYVIHNEDGTISVTLPEDKSITYANRTTVTVLDSIGKPIANVSVTVKDIAEKSYTAITDENGVIVVPPLSEDITDENGYAVVNGYNVVITDEQKPIADAFIVIADGKISVKLPEGATFDYANRITATVTDKDNAPVKDMSVTFTDSTDRSETNLTDENGKATVPPVDKDYTDVNGYSEVDGFIVTVVNENGAIEKAYIKHNAAVLNEDCTVKESENIFVLLPENVKFDHANRITITVQNKDDKTAISDMAIIISELAAEDAEAKTLNGKTNDKGIAVFPPLSEDITDGDGNSDITEEKPSKGEDTDGDGTEDKPGETVTTSYIVKVNDTKGIITGSFVEIKDGKVYVTLPETHTLTTANQTTVTVLDKENKPVANVSVTVKDATTEKTATTNASGQITVPVKTSSGGSSGGSSSGGGSYGGGGGSYSASTVNVKVIDKDGKTVSVTKSTGTDKVTLTLPTGKNLEKDDNYYTITVTDRNGKAKTDYTVILKDKSKNELSGKTDKNGVIVLPALEHKAYIVGYNDSTFRPDNDMSRAEAAVIFARLIAEAKGESITGKSTFTDVSSNAWYADYVGYLAKYDVIKGYTDKTFKPEASVTRAEFVSMAVRYYDLFNDVKKTGYTVKYTDVATNYWAYADIAFAKNIGWLNGYSDGSFRGDNNITRAEVVTVVNRATGRTADKEYVNDNFTKLNRFTDVTDSSLWYFYEVAESSNTHKAVTSTDTETWVK